MELVESRIVVEFGNKKYLRVSKGDPTWYRGETGRGGKVIDENLHESLEEEFEEVEV